MKLISVKCTTILAAIVFLFLFPVIAQVKIGAAGNPSGYAVLELDGGTNKGLLLPRLNNTQITALTLAPDGLLVYNTTDGFLYVRKNTAWQKITDATNTGGAGFTLPYNGSSSGNTPLFVLNSNGTADALRGYANSGDGITGGSVSGNGGYFASTTGNALVTVTGNVGIATINPQFQLDVNGRARIRSNGSDNSAGIWYDKIYTTGQSSFVGTFNDSSFGIWSGGNWKFVFDHINNNMGISNINPKAPLSLSNASGNKLDIYYASANSRYGIGLQAALMQLYSAGVSDDIAFGYGSSTAFTENMRIKGNGNVGIGAINPAAKLEVRQSTASNALNVIQAGTGNAVYAQNTSATSTIFAFNNGTGPAVTTLGRMGVNNLDPGFTLDVAGRMRLRNESAGVSAGVWLDGTTSASIGFIGTNTNNTIGLYGNGGAGWGLLMNTDNANISIGTGAAANSKLQVAGSVSMPYIEVTDNYAITDNDYSVRFVTTFNTSFSRTLYLPPAAGRTGRIYKISAKIPVAGPARLSDFTPARVYLLESGTNINVIQNNLDGIDVFSTFAFENYQSLGGTNLDVHGVIKRLSLTVQSNGTSWKVIEDSFQGFIDYKPEQ